MNQDLVSVIIPSYNRADCLDTAIESLEKQSYSPIEVMVIDDGSTCDITSTIKNYPNTVYLKQKNEGVSIARNRGVKASNGKFITFLDDDDTLPTESLKKRVDYLNNNPCIDIVVGSTRYFNVQGDIVSVRDPTRCNYDDLAIDFLNYKFAPFHPMSALYKREIFEKIGFFNPNLKRFEDGEFCYRYLSNCKVGVIEDVVYNYFVSSHSLNTMLGVQWKTLLSKIKTINESDNLNSSEKTSLILGNIAIFPSNIIRRIDYCLKIKK